MATVSVIIPNMNGRHLLETCLRTVYDNGQAVSEVIIVDNGSTDQSLEFLNSKYGAIKVIPNTVNLGFAEACNQGASFSIGEFLLFLNNDILLSPNAITELVHVLNSHTSVAACQPSLLTPQGEIDSLGSQMTRFGFLHHVEQQESSEEGDVAERFSLKGACLLVRKSAFIDVEGFDPSYFAYFEESDLCWRLRLRGWKVAIARNISVVHLGGATTGRYFRSDRIDYLSFKNRVTTIMKNAGSPLLVRMLALHLTGCLIISFAFLIVGKPKNSAAILKALYWNFANRQIVMQKRAIVQSRRLLADSELKESFVPIRALASLKLLRYYLVRW